MRSVRNFVCFLLVLPHTRSIFKRMIPPPPLPARPRAPLPSRHVCFIAHALTTHFLLSRFGSPLLVRVYMRSTPLFRAFFSPSCFLRRSPQPSAAAAAVSNQPTTMIKDTTVDSDKSRSGNGTDGHCATAAAAAAAARRRFELSKPHLENLVASARSLLTEEKASWRGSLEERHVHRGAIFKCSSTARTPLRCPLQYRFTVRTVRPLNIWFWNARDEIKIKEYVGFVESPFICTHSLRQHGNKRKRTVTYATQEHFADYCMIEGSN